ncbi:cytidine deaminase [Tubulinosema ratisbonensis]|uniref:Cytidine deaminase n=1 Tax=Tubulinosema ratisbonensis TaxID=291195 RepID=A0A437AMH5_9MICR|nr:cytidine deaminase [Tubulinosema ratisbonensis]
MDDYFMDLTIKLSSFTLSTNEVPISCILTYNNKIISYGYNLTNEESNPLAHAEIICLKKINIEIFKTPKNSLLEEYSKLSNENLKSIIDYNPKVTQENNKFKMYISCEPCTMCYGILARLPLEIYYGCTNYQFGCTNIGNMSGGILLFRKEAVVNLRKFFLKENLLAPEEKRILKKNRKLKEI